MDMNTVDQPFGELNISVDKSKLEAYLFIKYFVQDNNVQNDASVPKRYENEDILRALEAKGIIHGIRYENFDEAIKGNKEVLIAKGTEPTSPVDDTIKYYFPVTQERKINEKEGKVDFLDVGAIFYVKEGELLARVIEGKDGAPGRDVFGKLIPGYKKKRVRLKKGPNCEYTSDRLGIISKIPGMPCLKNDTIAVFDTYNLNSDVDYKTGNIVFDGNVYVNGSVKEGMKISSRGFIKIAENVDSAELKADGNITVMRNLICSVIKAGASEVPDKTALMYLKEITSFFISFKDTMRLIIENGNFPNNKNMAAVIKAVLQLKYKDIGQTINSACAYFKKTKTDSNMSELFIESIKLYRLMEAGMLPSTGFIEKQSIKNNDYIEDYESIFTSSDATVSNCQNSTIYATNDVVIFGKGCYNTNIFANKNVSVTGHPGIFRGGSISAGLNVSIGELGSEAEVLTIIHTTKEGIVTAEKVYPNVYIYFDNMVYRVENPYKHFKAYVKEREIYTEKQKL